MDYAKLIKDARKSQHLTQAQLAQKAQVGMATIQNIEAGKANLEVTTLEKILKPLGLELTAKAKKIDWGLWISLGVPLYQTEVDKNIRPEKSLLLEQFPHVDHILQGLEPNSREELAFYNFLFAIAHHYPSTFQKLTPLIQKMILSQLGKKISPKLRRMALARLQEYL